MTKETVEIKESTILSILSNYRKIEIEAYVKGNPDKVSLLIDIDILLRKAKLTPLQKQIVDLYYIKQLTQAQTSKELNVTQQAISYSLPIIKERIKTVARDCEV